MVRTSTHKKFCKVIKKADAILGELWDSVTEAIGRMDEDPEAYYEDEFHALLREQAVIQDTMNGITALCPELAGEVLGWRAKQEEGPMVRGLRFRQAIRRAGKEIVRRLR